MTLLYKVLKIETFKILLYKLVFLTNYELRETMKLSAKNISAIILNHPLLWYPISDISDSDDRRIAQTHSDVSHVSKRFD